MNLKQTDGKEMPQFSLEIFTLHELNQNGLVTRMDGDDAIRYDNRYVVKNIDYTDNSREFLVNMKAKKGLYKNDVVYLNGDVKLHRDDGLRFFSQKLTYNKVKDIAHTNVEYVAYMGENYITGKKVSFNNKKSTVKSKKIYAVYNLEEKKK
jgi:LPS export ABC transporter protein LptC